VLGCVQRGRTRIFGPCLTRRDLNRPSRALRNREKY